MVLCPKCNEHYVCHVNPPFGGCFCRNMHYFCSSCSRKNNHKCPFCGYQALFVHFTIKKPLGPAEKAEWAKIKEMRREKLRKLLETQCTRCPEKQCIHEAFMQQVKAFFANYDARIAPNSESSSPHIEEGNPVSHYLPEAVLTFIEAADLPNDHGTTLDQDVSEAPTSTPFGNTEQISAEVTAENTNTPEESLANNAVTTTDTICSNEQSVEHRTDGCGTICHILKGMISCAILLAERQGETNISVQNQANIFVQIDARAQRSVSDRAAVIEESAMATRTPRLEPVNDESVDCQPGVSSSPAQSAIQSTCQAVPMMAKGSLASTSKAKPVGDVLRISHACTFTVQHHIRVSSTGSQTNSPDTEKSFVDKNVGTTFSEDRIFEAFRNFKSQRLQELQNCATCSQQCSATYRNCTTQTEPIRSEPAAAADPEHITNERTETVTEATEDEHFANAYRAKQLSFAKLWTEKPRDEKKVPENEIIVWDPCEWLKAHEHLETAARTAACSQNDSLWNRFGFKNTHGPILNWTRRSDVLAMSERTSRNRKTEIPKKDPPKTYRLKYKRRRESWSFETCPTEPDRVPLTCYRAKFRQPTISFIEYAKKQRNREEVETPLRQCSKISLTKSKREEAEKTFLVNAITDLSIDVTPMDCPDRTCTSPIYFSEVGLHLNDFHRLRGIDIKLGQVQNFAINLNDCMKHCSHMHKLYFVYTADGIGLPVVLMSWKVKTCELANIPAAHCKKNETYVIIYLVTVWTPEAPLKATLTIWNRTGPTPACHIVKSDVVNDVREADLDTLLQHGKVILLNPSQLRVVKAAGTELIEGQLIVHSK